MNVVESLKRHARFLAAGFLSFLAILAAMRWSEGEPLVQPPSDLGLVIGFVLIAAFFVVNDTGGQGGSKAR
jgi:hypothetical protein